MSDVPLNTYIQKRGSTSYFRIRVPSDIVETFGRAEIKESLRTKDLAEAKKRELPKLLEVEALFEAHRQSRDKGGVPAPALVQKPSPSAPLTSDACYQQVWDEEQDRRHAIYEQVEADLEGFFAGKYVTHPRDEWYYHVTQEGDWSMLLSYCLRHEVKTCLADLKLDQNLGNIAHHKPLAGGDTRKARALLAAEISALEDLLKDEPPEQLHAATVSYPVPVAPVVESPEPTALSTSPAPLLSAVAEEWLRERAKELPEKTVKTNRAHISQFLTVAGDKAINTYTKADVRRFKGVLEALPPNWNKKSDLKAMGMVAAADHAKANGLQANKPRNTNNILASCSTCFTWLMVNHDELKTNPFKGIKVAFKENVREARDPFTEAELVELFTSPKFKALKRNSAKHWVPLISLYTGMRASEICQLYVTDVRADGGVHYLDNNEDQPDKKLKTASSKRKSPIHQTLIELGFLDFVEKRRKADPKGRLFPDVKMAADGYYSTNFGKWFSRFLTSVGVKREKLSFHSFRHTFEDAARRAKIDHSIMNALQGHGEGDMSDRYGRGYPLEVLDEALQKISYEGLTSERVKSL